MLIVIAATLSERGRVVANGYVVDGLHLSGSAAADLQALVQRPPDATEPITLVGVALLVLSVFGFTRTLQRTCQAAWDLPTQGLRVSRWGSSVRGHCTGHHSRTARINRTTYTLFPGSVV